MSNYASLPLTERFDAGNFDDRSVHVLIQVTRGADGAVTESLVGNPASWGNCQHRWQAADEERRAAGTPMHTLHYKVRSADDPAVAGLLRLYVSQLHAAHAFVRASSISRYRVADTLKFQYGGWWKLSKDLRRCGYIGTLRDGRAYITANGRAMTKTLGMQA